MENLKEPPRESFLVGENAVRFVRWKPRFQESRKNLTDNLQKKSLATLHSHTKAAAVEPSVGSRLVNPRMPGGETILARGMSWGSAETLSKTTSMVGRTFSFQAEKKSTQDRTCYPKCRGGMNAQVAEFFRRFRRQEPD